MSCADATGGFSVDLVVLQDTGSADFWVISDACTGNCTSTVPLYHQSTFRPAGQQVQLLYGDSRTGTHALRAISPVVDGNYVYVTHGEDNVDTTAFGRIQCIDATQRGFTGRSRDAYDQYIASLTEGDALREVAESMLSSSQFLANGLGVGGARSEVGGPSAAGGRGQPRQRTKTGPESPGQSPGTPGKRGGPPPSSWNTRSKPL